MQTVFDLYRVVRERFPSITALADRVHIERWNDLDFDLKHLWFESLADALNTEMQREVPYATHSSLFTFMASAVENGTEDIHKCIDVAFIENLFWRVPHTKITPYWAHLPSSLRNLYGAFHRHAPDRLR